MNGARGYGAAAKLLHWGMAALLVVTWTLGLFQPAIPGLEAKEFVLFLHRAFGEGMFALLLLRLGVRLAHGAPPPPEPLPAGLRVAMRAGHGALYLLMAALPVTGTLASWAAGESIPLWTFTPPLAANEGLAVDLRQLHEILAFAFAFLVVGHAAAAFHHQERFGGVLVRMLPGDGE